LWKELCVNQKFPSNALSLVTYAAEAKKEVLQADVETAMKQISWVSASGGTNFGAAFTAIQNVARQEAEGKHLVVIFFTDGQDTSNGWHVGRATPQHVMDSLNNLRQFISTRSGTSEVHTVGFTGDHDAYLLSEITKVRKKKEIYFYFYFYFFNLFFFFFFLFTF
jgi:hypothetical protein